MIVGSKKAIFKYMNDQIWISWCLSQAGRKVLIKSTLQSIPYYVMSVFIFPETLTNEIEKMLNPFCWSRSTKNSR